MSDLSRLRRVNSRKGANADAFRGARVTAHDIGRSKHRGDTDARAMLARVRNDGFICPLIIARTAAQVPLRLYRKVSRSNVRLVGRALHDAERSRMVKRYRGTKAAAEMDSAEEVVELLPGQHPLADLIARPNTMHSGTTYRTVQMFNLLWAGNAYELIDLEGGTPASLFMMPPHEVVPVVNADGVLTDYSYSRSSSQFEVDSSEVVHHLHTVNPTDPYSGFGPMHGVTSQIDTLNELWDMELSRAERNQRPDFHVKIANASGSDAEELRNYYSEAFAGAGNAPRAFFSNELVEILPLAWSPKDTDLDQRFQRLRKAVWQAFGVPQSVMELNDANLASALVSNGQFGRQTISPLLGAYADDMNEQLLPWYDDSDSLFVCFDNPVPEDNIEQLTDYRAEVASGVRSINEYRAAAGLDPVPDDVGDVLRFNGVPLDEMGVAPLGGFGSPLGGGLALPPSLEPDAEGQQLAEPEKVAEQALNGAQIAQLVEIARQVQSGELPKAAGLAVALAAFPGIPQSKLSGVFESLVEGGSATLKSSGPAPKGSKSHKPKAKLYSASDPWYDHVCGCNGCKSGHTHKANNSDVLPPAEEQPVDPMTEAIAQWYNMRAPEALNNASLDGVVDMRPYADELESILDKFLPDLFRNGVGFGADEMGVDIDDALSVASDAAIQYSRDNAPIIAQSAADSATEGLSSAVQSAVTQGLEQGEAIRDIIDSIPDVSTSRAERIARTEVQEAQQQGKLQSWENAGVESKEWLLAGDACPICNAIKAKYPGKVPIEKPFLKRGETIIGTDGRPFTASFRAVTAPPAHPNCRCTLVASQEDDE